jgi:hypothetical protein
LITNAANQRRTRGFRAGITNCEIPTGSLSIRPLKVPPSSLQTGHGQRLDKPALNDEVEHDDRQRRDRGTS